jgi:hypothetical protein
LCSVLSTLVGAGAGADDVLTALDALAGGAVVAGTAVGDGTAVGRGAAEEDAADEETAPAGVATPPDGPYPVGAPRGANWLPTSSMTPSTPPVSSVIVDVSSFTSACTRHDRAGVQRRR